MEFNFSVTVVSQRSMQVAVNQLNGVPQFWALNLLDAGKNNEYGLNSKSSDLIFGQSVSQLIHT